MNICRNCTHCIEEYDERGLIWYNFRCGHPDHERLQEQDPVTGELAYAEVNALGDVVFTDEKHPYCREKNQRTKANVRSMRQRHV